MESFTFRLKVSYTCMRYEYREGLNMNVHNSRTLRTESNMRALYRKRKSEYEGLSCLNKKPDK